MDNNDQKPEVMTTEQAAEYLQIHPRTLTDMAQDGRIPAKKLGNRWRFSKKALDAWLADEDGERTNG